ncbi:MAG: tRNA-dihydrouridine synthase family protein, partial [Anaerolineae bacterium]|nr:tRNA-dihydrouridine synthase family protein [Anaerolineae bacterium]
MKPDTYHHQFKQLHHVEKTEEIFPSFYVDNIPVFGDIILAPMDGYSDWPFRSICRQLGSAMSYTEFVSAANLINRPPYDAQKLHYTEDERPMVFQIYGRHVDEILTAALKMQEKSPDIIDVNMGCPSKSVANGGAGVGLMRTPLKVARIFRALEAALDVPITGKIRLGWDEDCRSYRLIARIIEENGGQMIAVHGRTKVQGYGGQADWDAIAEIKAAVNIPV